MRKGRRGKKPDLSEMPENSSPLEEDGILFGPHGDLEEATVDFHTMDELMRDFLGPNAELLIDPAELVSTGFQESFTPFQGSFEIDDESEKELFDTAGLKTTGLGPEDASDVFGMAETISPGINEAKSIGSCESFDDVAAKETTETAGLKTTGLEPEQLSGSVNRGEGAVGGWQEANPSTELQLSRQLSAPRQIPFHAFISYLRTRKLFDGLTDRQLAQEVKQGLSHKKPILPSTDSTLETRVQGTEKVPKTISRKGTGKKRGPYKEQQRHARSGTKNHGESISESFKYETLPRYQDAIRFVSHPQAGSEDGKADTITVENPETLPRYQETIMFVSKPQAGSEDGKANSSTVENQEGEKEVLSSLCVLSYPSRPLYDSLFFFNLINRVSTPN
jgi:hypothetical protein